ncbi:MAG: hypothetical protein C0176_03690 [Mesoaciditoga sp.]|nr:MAG: hypothetical protein C0185_00835 [Mesoaciditoga sp.]PMP79973.1 MAG: hypothetical protein C0176_03690 [Mesoaciditoga sp.]
MKIENGQLKLLILYQSLLVDSIGYKPYTNSFLFCRSSSIPGGFRVSWVDDDGKWDMKDVKTKGGNGNDLWEHANVFNRFKSFHRFDVKK